MPGCGTELEPGVIVGHIEASLCQGGFSRRDGGDRVSGSGVTDPKSR